MCINIVRVAIFYFLSFSLFASEDKKIDLQLQWKHQFEFAGFYIAKQKGFYKNIGLDVQIKQWNHGIDIVDEIIKNKSQYAVARPTSLIEISKNKEIAYLAAIYQTSPLVLLAKKDSNIKSIKDFKNKKIMITKDHINDSSITSMFFSQGLRLEDIKIVKHSFDVKDLLNGKTDLIASYISNEPYLLKELGVEPIVFKPKDYGFDFYNDILITSKKYIRGNKEEVDNFKKATIKGYEYAFSNIDETVDLIYEKYNSQNKTKQALRYEAYELKKLLYDDLGDIGTIKLNKLERMFDIYKLLGLAKNDVNLNEVIFKSKVDETLLSDEEKLYIKNKKIVNICIDPNWPPLEFFDKNDEFKGISADYYQLFSKNSSLQFQAVKTKSWEESKSFIKDKKCDILSLVMANESKKQYMNFTSTFLKLPLVLATKHNVSFVNDLEDIKGKKIGAPKGYSYVKKLQKAYPFLEFVEVENVQDGLNKVTEKKLFAYVGTLADVAYNLQNRFAGELKIAGKVSEDWHLSIGVRNDDLVLLNILQKAINSMTEKQQKDILNNWVSIKYENNTDYTLLYQVLSVFTLILLIFTYFYNQKRKLHKKLEIAYKQLEKLAVTDKLTGLYNRHKMDELIMQQKDLSCRYGTRFGIIIIDIDHFKSINDNHGHHVGDEVLKDFAMILKDNSRNTDYIGRWGGEEFLIVVPKTEKNTLIKFSENLRKSVENYNFNQIKKVTASFGITKYTIGENIEKTIIRADEALYEAKNKGRNKVVFR